jgi:hypothetical protein
MATKPAHDFLIFLIGGSLFAAGVFLFTDSLRRLRVGDDCGWWWVDAADAAAFPE